MTDKKSYKQLTEEVIDILLISKNNIKENSDCVWTRYRNAKEIHFDIDRYIAALKNGNKELLEEANNHFLATSTFQEHSISNNWTDEYLKLSERFDELFKRIKNYN